MIFCMVRCDLGLKRGWQRCFCYGRNSQAIRVGPHLRFFELKGISVTVVVRENHTTDWSNWTVSVDL